MDALIAIYLWYLDIVFEAVYLRLVDIMYFGEYIVTIFYPVTQYNDTKANQVFYFPHVISLESYHFSMNAVGVFSAVLDLTWYAQILCELGEFVLYILDVIMIFSKKHFDLRFDFFVQIWIDELEI